MMKKKGRSKGSKIKPKTDPSTTSELMTKEAGDETNSVPEGPTATSNKVIQAIGNYLFVIKNNVCELTTSKT